MPIPRALVATVLCCALPIATLAAESQVGYDVTYSGGSLPNVKGGEGLKLYLDATRVRLTQKSHEIITIPASSITEVSYGEEVHHRIGTAVGLAVVSLGIGALVAFSKSKKHYIGITWADSSRKGGIVLQADKNEYRGLLTALEGVSGKTAVNADTPKQAAHPNSAQAPPAPAVEVATLTETPAQATRPQPQAAPPAPADTAQVVTLTETTAQPTRPQPQAVPPAPVSTPRPPQVAPAQAPLQPKSGVVIRFTSTPSNAEVQIDGEYWGSTPTASLTRIPAGPHTILVRKLGYQPWERKITLAEGDDRTVDAELELDGKDPTKPRISGQQ
jgi:hypothetical protein